MARNRFEIILAPEAVEDRGRLRAFDRAVVDDAVERHLRYEPRRVSRSRIKRLAGLNRPQFRLRVEDLRVFYDVVGNEVQVLGIVAKAEVRDWLARESEPS
jgi:mRNA interferase RelE/StbE